MHEPNNVKGKSHITNCVKAAPVGQKCKMKKYYSEKFYDCCARSHLVSKMVPLVKDPL